MVEDVAPRTHFQGLPGPTITLRVMTSRQDLREEQPSGCPSTGGKASFEADAIQQYGRQDKVRIVGLDDGGNNEDPYEDVITVVEYCGESLKGVKIRVFHRLFSRKGGKRPFIARFVRKEKKIELIRKKNPAISIG